MFIFLMSARLSPYFASSSSSKIASSNVFEHSSPMLRLMRRPTLPTLRCFMIAGDARLAAHPDERDPLRAALDGLGVRHRVRGVRVAASRRGDDVVLGARDAGHGLPGRAVALEVRDEGRVDDVVLECVEQERRHEPTVLADLEEHGIGRAREHDVLRDARHLVGLAHPPEQELVGLGLPGAEPWARTRAGGAPLLPVAAVAGREAVLGLERLVDAAVVAVPEHVVRAHDDAARAAGAQAGRDDLVVQVLPLELLGRHAPSLSCARRGSPLAIRPVALPAARRLRRRAAHARCDTDRLHARDAPRPPLAPAASARTCTHRDVRRCRRASRSFVRRRWAHVLHALDDVDAADFAIERVTPTRSSAATDVVVRARRAGDHPVLHRLVLARGEEPGRARPGSAAPGLGMGDRELVHPARELRDAGAGDPGPVARLRRIASREAIRDGGSRTDRGSSAGGGACSSSRSWPSRARPADRRDFDVSDSPRRQPGRARSRCSAPRPRPSSRSSSSVVSTPARRRASAPSARRRARLGQTGTWGSAFATARATASAYRRTPDE